MKSNLKLTKLLCMALISSIIIAQPCFAQAAEANYFNKAQVPTSTFKTMLTENDIQQVYDDLSFKAKEIFLDYLIHTNNYLYQYHKRNVIETNDTIQITKKIQNSTYSTYQSNKLSMSITNSVTMASNALDTLSSNLNQIKGLSDAVIYALIAAGSTIIADIASLGTAKIATIILGAGCLVVLLAHWDEVSAAWPEIVDAFKNAFGNSISTDTVESEFSIAKLRLQQDNLRNINAIETASRCIVSPSCNKHIDVNAARSIIRRGRRLAIYSSHFEDKALLVIRIPKGTTADISKNLASTIKKPTDISFGTLYVLYNPKTHKYFHMHVTLFHDDTHYLRHANGLCYQLYPTFSYDKQYDHPGHKLHMPTHNNW